MSPTIEDLRSTLDEVAHGYEAPDPHTVLAGVHERSAELGRHRTTRRWAAAAAAVVAIGGASLLLTDLGGDSQGEVAPAEPDESYTEGFGIIDGVPQPYADGLTLVETFDEILPNGGMVADEFRTDAETQMYAQAWCATGTSEVEIELGTFETGLERVTAPCADPAVDTAHLSSPVALPPDVQGLQVIGGGSETGVALVAIYEEAAWGDYPFPSWDREPFPSTEGIVIDSSTPMTSDPALDSVMTPRRVHSVTVPLTDEALSIDMQLNGPGQLLVAIDGVVLTNDGEVLDRLEQTVPGRWNIADPSLREGYLHSFGQEQRKTGGGFTPEVLAEDGIDVSDGEITISVDARGFPNDDWRVVISSDGAGDGLGATEPLEPVEQSDFAEYAFGHRLVAAYEVPADGVARSVSIDPARAETLTWVPQCPDTIEQDSRGLQPDIGSLDIAGSVSTFTCLSEVNFNDAVTPDATSQSNADGSVTLAMHPSEGVTSRRVAVYEPVPFDEFPFDQAEPMSSFPAPDLDPTPAKEGQLDLERREGARITMDDLDEEGRATFEVSASDLTELYVSTEGVGRFRLESVAPVEGTITAASQGGSLSGQGLEREGWWTSWTDRSATWPITPQTEAGVVSEQVTVQVEGYESGSFELRVIGTYLQE